MGKHHAQQNQRYAEIATHNILSGCTGDRGGGDGVKHSTGKRESGRSPQQNEPEKDQSRNECGPQPYIPCGECGKIGIVLKPQFIGGRLFRRKNKAFDTVAPSEQPFERHVHLCIRRNIGQISKPGIVRGNAFAVCNIFCISEHHGAFDRVRNEIRTFQGQGVAEIPETERFRVFNHGSNPRRFHVVMACFNKK